MVIIGALFEDTITTHHWRPYHNVKKMGQKYYRYVAVDTSEGIDFSEQLPLPFDYLPKMSLGTMF